MCLSSQTQHKTRQSLLAKIMSFFSYWRILLALLHAVLLPTPLHLPSQTAAILTLPSTPRSASVPCTNPLSLQLIARNRCWGKRNCKRTSEAFKDIRSSQGLQWKILANFTFLFAQGNSSADPKLLWSRRSAQFHDSSGTHEYKYIYTLVCLDIFLKAAALLSSLPLLLSVLLAVFLNKPCFRLTSASQHPDKETLPGATQGWGKELCLSPDHLMLAKEAGTSVWRRCS